MARELIHSFTIKIANFTKVKKEASGSIVSRKCYAVVVKDGDKLKARINTSPVEESDKFILIDFTPKSLSLKGKTYVFLKEKDKYGHFVCRIRTIDQSNLFPGLTTQYDALHEGLYIAGHIIRKNGKLYFEYEDLIAYKENGERIFDTVRIEEDKPVFKDEYNRNKSS